MNAVVGKPVDNEINNKRHTITKRPILMRKSTKSPSSNGNNNEFMPMASMQMINRNAMMHNKFGSKQQIKTTKSTPRTTINPLCASQIALTENVTKGVRPNTIFTSYNWLPSR